MTLNGASPGLGARRSSPRSDFPTAVQTHKPVRSATHENRENGIPATDSVPRLSPYFEDLDTALRGLFPSIEAYEEAKADPASRIRDDLAALARVTKRMAGKPGAADLQKDYERIIGTNDLVNVNYLTKGLMASATVARVTGPDFRASGFMVGPRLFMTNRHVFPGPDVARGSYLEFNYELDVFGNQKSTEVYRLAPDDCCIIGDTEDLDYCLVAVEPVSEKSVPLSTWGYLQLLATTGKVTEGEWISIIQHPGGEPKQVALRENQVIKIGDIHTRPVLLYRSDTAPGSSGSPCFNDNWSVVALHSQGIPKKTAEGEFVLRAGESVPNLLQAQRQSDIDFECNLGVRISAIIADISTKAGVSRDGKGPLVKDFLTDIQRAGPRTPPIKPGAGSSTGLVVPGTAVRGSYHLTNGVGTVLHDGEATRPSRGRQPARRKKSDRGYNPDFLGVRVLMPTVTRDATRFGEPYTVPETGTNELQYTHFSVIMNKSRRLAFVSAVNIDGANRVSIRREDKFYLDTSHSQLEAIQCGEWLYSHNKLDRGHITRRQDPVWGDAAEQANTDTFYFTNIAPQHKDFNQGKQLWAGLEDFVLNNTTAEATKASVFSGPIFRRTDPSYRGVQIPLEFYKVVVVVDDDGYLRSSGYIVSQAPDTLVGDATHLDDDEAARLPEVEEQLPIGPFKMFQASIREIEDLTGLLWDATVVAADAMVTRGGVSPVTSDGDTEAMATGGISYGRVALTTFDDIKP